MTGATVIVLTAVLLPFHGLRPSADVTALDGQVAQAKQLFEQEKYTEAADLYKTIASQLPTNPTIAADWMASEINLRQYETARQIGQEYVAKNGPVTAHFLVVYGNVFHILGQTDEALVQYQRAYERAPHDLTAALDLADLLVEQKKYNEAQTVAEGATTNDVPIVPEDYPSNQEYFEAINQYPSRLRPEKVEQPLVYYMLARIAQAKGETDQATQYRDQAKQLEVSL